MAQKVDNGGANISHDDDDERFVLEDYDSDDQKHSAKSVLDRPEGKHISAANMALLEKSVSTRRERTLDQPD